MPKVQSGNRTAELLQPFNPHIDSCGFYVADAVDKHPDLLLIDKRVYRKLVSYNGKQGCFPRGPLLAKILGVCDRTIQYALKRLEAFGLIRRIMHIEKGRRRSNRFIFLWVESFFAPCVAPSIAPQEEYPADKENSSTSDCMEQPPCCAAEVVAPVVDFGPIANALTEAHKAVGGDSKSVATENWTAETAEKCSAAYGAEVSAKYIIHVIETLKRRVLRKHKNARPTYLAWWRQALIAEFAGIKDALWSRDPELEVTGGPQITWPASVGSDNWEVF